MRTEEITVELTQAAAPGLASMLRALGDATAELDDSARFDVDYERGAARLFVTARHIDIRDLVRWAAATQANPLMPTSGRARSFDSSDVIMVGLSARGLHAALNKIASTAGLDVRSTRDARAHPRLPLVAPVAVRLPDDTASAPRLPRGAPVVATVPASPVVELSYESDTAAFSTDYLENLSLGGAFIRTSTPHKEMTDVVLALTLPDGFRLETRATVVHVAANGMGVQFHLSEDVERLLDQALVRISAPKKRGLVVGKDERFVDDVMHELAGRGLAPVTALSLGDGLRALADEATDVEVVVVRVDESEPAIERFVETVRFAGANDLAVVLVGAFDANAWRDRSVDTLVTEACARDIVDAAMAAGERRRSMQRDGL